MIDHAKAREILNRNHELARRLGYTPEAQRPEVIVAMNTPQGRLDELVAAGYRPVIDERFSRMLGELPEQGKITQDPITGVKTYSGSLHSVQAAISVSGSVGSPPTINEPPPGRLFPISNGITVDRYSLNPASDFYTQLLAGSTFVGSAPEMFANGPLPPFTASGVDPSALRWAPWTHRHSAAMSESRSKVLMIVQLGLTGTLDLEDSQTADGRALWDDYMGRVASWVQAVPIDEMDGGIQAQIDRLYGPGADTGD